MSARDASSVKAVRRIIAASLFILLAALAFRFVLRRPPSPSAGAKEPAAGAGKVDRKEGIEHREYKNGQVWADLRADRFYLGEDGLNHLEGAVEITDYGRADGRETRISAAAVAYDKDMYRFALSGRVRVAGEGLVFETESLVYDKSKGTYVAERGGAFSSEALSGSGAAVAYDQGNDEVRLSGGFRLEVRSGGDAPGTVELSGGSLIYNRTDRKGLAEDRVRLSGGEAEGTAEVLTFALSDDERLFREASFETSAKCVFTGGKGRAERRSVEAGTIRVVSAPGPSRVSRVEAAGGCALTLSGPSGPSGTVRADLVRLDFTGEGALAEWNAKGGALMSVDGGAEGREAAGESISYSGTDGLLTVSAGPERAARLESARSRVEAKEVALETAGKDIRASGGVRCLLKPRPDGEAVGFFSGGEAVFVTARSLRSSAGGGRLLFAGEVRAWQGDASLQAGELEVTEGTGVIMGRGGVSAALPHPRKASWEERVEAGGEDMAYSPAGRTVLFKGRGFVKTSRARLTAGTVTVALLEAKKELKDLQAGGGVVVSLGRYEGRGREARYDPEAETLVLTGSPVLVEKGKGETRGDKLTFCLADDKILIENRGQGRSITVVKS